MFSERSVAKSYTPRPRSLVAILSSSSFMGTAIFSAYRKSVALARSKVSRILHILGKRCLSARGLVGKSKCSAIAATMHSCIRVRLSKKTSPRACHMFLFDPRCFRFDGMKEHRYTLRNCGFWREAPIIIHPREGCGSVQRDSFKRRPLRLGELIVISCYQERLAVCVSCHLWFYGCVGSLS